MEQLYAGGPAPPALIIPGLPNDIAMLCLLKVPRIYHSCLASVCLTWRNAVCRPQFYQDRRLLGSTDAWLVLVSAEILSTPILLYSVYDLSTRQLLFKVKFPPSLQPPAERCITYGKSVRHGGLYGAGATVDPACNISFFGDVCAAGNGRTVGGANSASCFVDTNLYNLDCYGIVAMKEYFAVLGFTQRSHSHAATCTFTIYNTVTDEWQHRRPLSICRDTFACGVIDGRLYVAGGRNEKGETERTMEVYDFEADEWGQTAEVLPDGIAEIQGDAVYEGKLYVQCWEIGREERCEVWVYNPREDQWKMEQNGEDVGGKQLIATEKCIYAMGGEEDLLRYKASSGKWSSVGGQRKAKASAGPIKVCPTGFVYCRHHPQRAFGHRLHYKNPSRDLLHSF